MKKFLLLMLVISSIVPATQVSARTDLPPMHQRRKFELSTKFVERLAWCETHGDWKNGGNWAGGLGIARSTWIAWGGRQFGATPDRATKHHQIVVANRIALWGFTRADGRFLHPVGLNGWGALDCARPVRLVVRRIHRSLAFSAHEAGNPYDNAE